MPTTSTGMNSAAIKGSVFTAASSCRRMTMPHIPPVMCWIIRIARQPSVIPSHNMKPIKYEWKNCSRVPGKMAAIRDATPKMIPTASDR